MSEDSDDTGAESVVEENEVESVSSEEEVKYVKLQLPEHIAAFKENRNLDRDVEPLACDNRLLEKITANYVIAKKIISNLSWQDKLLCKNVCNLWHSIVHTLQKEQLAPVDCSLNMRANSIKNGIRLLKSSNFYTEPLAILIFTNRSGFLTSVKCEALVPCPCDPPCDMEHYIIDVTYQNIAAPKNCMLIVKGCFLTNFPLPQSVTYENSIRHKMYLDPDPFIGGFSIPAIPNVKFTVINIKSVDSLQECFLDVVNNLAEIHHFKGVLVFANDSYLLHSVEDIIFLNHFRKVQPSVPYALGGCMVEDVLSDHNEVLDVLTEGADFIGDNLITIAMFSAPKDISPDDINNFSIFSHILESSDWSKAKVQSSINEFAKQVPQFEHSAALKLSCVGRDQKHEIEQQCFRQAFPTTRLIGCYGNGELGINHPACPVPEEPPKAKRNRQDHGPQFRVMYSYSTVFVYFGWGKIVSPPTSK